MSQVGSVKSEEGGSLTDASYHGDISSDINIFISDTDIKTIMSNKESLKCLARRIVGVRRRMTKREFEHQTNNLYKCCLKGVRDLHELHKRRVTGMQIINDIILRVDPMHISVTNVIHIIWSIMSCIHHFQLRLRTGSRGLVNYARRRKAAQCMDSYIKLLRLFQPSLHRIVLNSIMTFYKEGKLWEMEFACTDLVMQLLMIYDDVEEPINDILNMVEQASLVNVTESKHLIQVLYELMKEIRWRSMSEKLMVRMITMLRSSMIPEANEQFNYAPLRKGLELCVRNAINNLQNKDLLNMISITVQNIDGKMDEACMLDFGNIAAFAASKFSVKTFFQKFKPGLLESIFRMTMSTKSVTIFVSARIWLNLINRSNNAAKLRAPRIYFQSCNYNIALKKCSHQDKLFFKGLRHNFYQAMMQSFLYSFKVCEMETVFQASALTLTEIPCGYSASPQITVALNLQEYAFNLSNTDNLVKAHHIHAIVLSLLSLICYIHKADVLYKYVMKIMERRAEWAPFLNPPLKSIYQYAQHHILWNKPDLFFEDWEVRYGLWKCFRLKKKYSQKNK